MRSLDKGACPKDTEGQEVVFARYQDAAPHLHMRIGKYCCYCERRIPAPLAVEHKLPKQPQLHPELETAWSNLLLACVNCNSTKATKVAPPEGVLWPDEDDTFSALDYRPSGAIRPQEWLDAGLRTRAHNLLSLVGLDVEPRRVTDSRWFDRLEAWALAEQSRMDLASQPTPEMQRAIINMARAVGLFSVWMAAFSDNDSMRQALVAAFPGTRAR